jgi:hypothetical protein
VQTGGKLLRDGCGDKGRRVDELQVGVWRVGRHRFEEGYEMSMRWVFVQSDRVREAMMVVKLRGGEGELPPSFRSKTASASLDLDSHLLLPPLPPLPHTSSPFSNMSNDLYVDSPPLVPLLSLAFREARREPYRGIPNRLRLRFLLVPLHAPLVRSIPPMLLHPHRYGTVALISDSSVSPSWFVHLARTISRHPSLFSLGCPC